MVLNRKTYKRFYDDIWSKQGFYNSIVKWCFLPFGGEEKCRQGLISEITFFEDERILDMCCGQGGATNIIAKMSGNRAEITGIDLSSGMIEMAKKKYCWKNVRFIEGDASNTKFKDNYFDKVFITHALHEMPREIRLNTLKEARRILKEKGEVIVLELDDPENFFVRLFIGFWFFYWIPFNFETPTRKDMLKHGLVNEAKEAGFNNIRKISKYRGIFQIVVGEK